MRGSWLASGLQGLPDPAAEPGYGLLYVGQDLQNITDKVEKLVTEMAEAKAARVAAEAPAPAAPGYSPDFLKAIQGAMAAAVKELE